MENNSISTTSITPEDIVAQIRALRAQIPDYTQSPADALGPVAKLDPGFVNAATSAISESDHLAKVLDTTAEQCAADSAEAERWQKVEIEIAALYMGVRNGNRTRSHRIGLRALQAYSVAKQLVRQPQHADLKPHLAEMRRSNRFGKGRRNGSPAPQPAPQQALLADLGE